LPLSARNSADVNGAGISPVREAAVGALKVFRLIFPERFAIAG
jgi:hypothetical protein